MRAVLGDDALNLCCCIASILVGWQFFLFSWNIGTYSYVFAGGGDDLEDQPLSPCSSLMGIAMPVREE